MLVKKKEKDVIDRMPDQIDFHGMTAEENGLLKKITSRFYSGVLDAEMDKHLGYKKNDNSGNSRNGYTRKTVITEDKDTIYKKYFLQFLFSRQISVIVFPVFFCFCSISTISFSLNLFLFVLSLFFGAKNNLKTGTIKQS